MNQKQAGLQPNDGERAVDITVMRPVTVPVVLSVAFFGALFSLIRQDIRDGGYAQVEKSFVRKDEGDDKGALTSLKVSFDVPNGPIDDVYGATVRVTKDRIADTIDVILGEDVAAGDTHATGEAVRESITDAIANGDPSLLSEAAVRVLAQVALFGCRFDNVKECLAA